MVVTPVNVTSAVIQMRGNDEVLASPAWATAGRARPPRDGRAYSSSSGVKSSSSGVNASSGIHWACDAAKASALRASRRALRGSPG